MNNALTLATAGRRLTNKAKEREADTDNYSSSAR